MKDILSLVTGQYENFYFRSGARGKHCPTPISSRAFDNRSMVCAIDRLNRSIMQILTGLAGQYWRIMAYFFRIDCQMDFKFLQSSLSTKKIRHRKNKESERRI